MYRMMSPWKVALHQKFKMWLWVTFVVSAYLPIELALGTIACDLSIANGKDGIHADLGHRETQEMTDDASSLSNTERKH